MVLSTIIEATLVFFLYDLDLLKYRYGLVIMSFVFLGCSQSSSSAGSSRRLSNNDSGLFPDSPISLPLTSRSPRNSAQLKSRSSSKTSITSSTNNAEGSSNNDHRASIENLSDFLSKMDSSIAVNKKATISMIKSSNIESEPSKEKEKESCDSSLNNTHTRLSDSSADEDVSVTVRNVKLS